ncbi:MAG: ABC transporter substrate-binding protein [Rhodopila sp.]|jgi:phospholipid transport system substrate-binding protein
MLKRRAATTTIGCAVLLLLLPSGSVRRAVAQPNERAIAFVTKTSGQLVAIVNSSDSAEQKHHHLQEVIVSTVDVDDIARFCLGRFWRIATPEQQQQYMALFHDLLVTEIAGHLGEYQGVKVTIGLARASEDTEIVITTVERPDNPVTQIDWVIATNTGGPKIVDLLAGGTSLRLTQSADFAAYLARHQYNIHELIEGMRQRIAQSQ